MMKRVQPILCLLLAALTACGPTNSAYTRGGGSASSVGEHAADRLKLVETWGAKQERPLSADPMVAPGWMLALRCPADPKLDGDYRIDFDGDLDLPYDIKINTLGFSLSQLHKKISEELKPYFKNPSDTQLTVKERRYWVDVRGLVQKPGRYLVEPDASLDAIIGLAGGFIKETPPQYVRIQKGNDVMVMSLDQYYNQAFGNPRVLGWLGGEVIFFQKEMSATGEEYTTTSSYQLPVRILGEVKKPGDYPLTPGADLTDALVNAGGFTDRADVERIDLIRKTPRGKRYYTFSWSSPDSAIKPQQGDIILVRADALTHSERKVTVWATVVGAVAAAVTAAVLVLSYNRNKI